MAEVDQILDNEYMQTNIAVTTSRLMRKYYKFVEAEDVRQQLSLVAWRKRKKFTEYLDRDDEVDWKRGMSATLKALWRDGDKYCRTEKARKSGYQTHDEAFYTRSMVEELIVRLHGGASRTEQTEDVKVRSTAQSWFNMETALADVDRALKMIDINHRIIIHMMIGEGQSAKTVAKSLGSTDTNIQSALDQAIEAVIQNLGGHSPY